MKAYLIGICGSGMSSLAGLLKEKGFEVEGSDSSFYPPASDTIERLNIKTYNYKDLKIKAHKNSIIIIGNVVGRGNPEVEYILSNKMKFFSMPETLNNFFTENKTLIMIAGTYGKTTTTGFLSYAFNVCNLKADFFLGGEIINFNKNYGVYNESSFFILEGDEYETSFFDPRSKFLHFSPDILILRELSHDHLDKFKTKGSYIETFISLFKRLPKEALILSHIKNKKIIDFKKHSYSRVKFFGKQSLKTELAYEIIDEIKNIFKVYIDGKFDDIYRISTIPLYDIENVLPGIYLLRKNGIKREDVKEAVFSYKGIKRRFEIIYRGKNITVIDDFSHHPNSLKSIISEVKRKYKKDKLSIYFEPSSYTMKMKKFQKQIQKALSCADLVFIEKPKPSKKIKEDELLNLNDLKKILGRKLLVLEEQSLTALIFKTLKERFKNRPFVFLIVSSSKRRELNKKKLWEKSFF